MKSFSKLYSDFWTGHNNSEVVNADTYSHIMALYLQSNPHSNAFGVYYLPLLYIASDLKLPVKQVQTTLEKLCEINYCKYDTKAQYVWVCNLASERVGTVINARDNRVKCINAIWKSLPPTIEFLKEVYQKYNSTFYLEPLSLKWLVKTYEIKKETALTKTNSSWLKSLPGVLFWNK